MKNEFKVNLSVLPIDVFQEIAERLHAWSRVEVFYNSRTNKYDISTSVTLTTSYDKDEKHLGSVYGKELYNQEQISYFSQKVWGNCVYD